MKNIAVFFGGVSVEHDVSILTGVMILNSLDKNKFIGVPIYVSQSGEWFTGDILKDIDEYKNLDYKKLKRVSFMAGSNSLYQVKNKRTSALSIISVAINCMHGERGEDGSLAGLLKMCNIPLASPDLLASSLFMDKMATKSFLKGIKVDCLPCIKISNHTAFGQELDQQIRIIEEKFGYPVIVKPVSLGSSIGITKAQDRRQLEHAISYALRFCTRALVEPCLTDFIELNCAVYKDNDGNLIASPCERPIGLDTFLSFDDKYKKGKREFPAKVHKNISSKVQKTAKEIYQSLDMSGVIRIDFLVCQNKVLVNEVNTVPGSLSYYLFCSTLKEFTGVLTTLISVAEREFAVSGSVKKKFSSSILFSVGNKSAKRL